MSQCIICDNDEFTTAAEFGPDLLRCQSCHLIFYGRLTEINPQAIYDPTYFNGVYYDYRLEKTTLQKNFSARLKNIKEFKSGGNLLDIGTAYGFFPELAKADFNVYGIDVAREGINYATQTLGLKNMVSGDYLNVKYQANFFDVVCLFDSIEHFKDPQLYLEKAANELKTGGLICLTTGDIDSPIAKLRKSRWRIIDPPMHLYYFSYDNMVKLLNKYNYEVVKKSYPGYSRSLASILYLSVFKGNESILKSRWFKLLQNFHFYLNTFDIMFVIAKKKGLINGCNIKYHYLT